MAQAADAHNAWLKPYAQKLFKDDKTIYAPFHSIGTDLQVYDSFVNTDRVDTSSTLKYNGTEYITPEAAGGSWTAATEVMTGTFFAAGHVGIGKDSSNQIWIVSEDSDDQIYLTVRDSANAQVTAKVVLTDAAGNTYQNPIMVVDDQDNGWVIYIDNSDLNKLTVSSVNSAGAVQNSIDEIQVDATNMQPTSVRGAGVVYDGDGHVWIFGMNAGNTNIYMQGRNTSDGTVFRASSKIAETQGTFTQMRLVADTTNKLMYLIVVSSTEDNIAVIKINSSGSKVESKQIDSSYYHDAIYAAAVNSSGDRLCIVVNEPQIPGGGKRILAVDTHTLKVVGSTQNVLSTNEDTVQNITAGPDDRFWFINEKGSFDLDLLVINKDSSIFTTITDVDTNAAQPAIIWNDHNTNNYVWIAYLNVGDNDIDTRTYDFQFDTNTDGFFVQSNPISRTNTASYGVTVAEIESNTGDTFQLDMSADNASNFNTGQTFGTPVAFSNTGTDMVVKITAVASNDYATPKIKGWLMGVNE